MLLPFYKKKTPVSEQNVAKPGNENVTLSLVSALHANKGKNFIC